jgi:hypothetical protein
MSTLAEIEAEIAKLPPKEFRELLSRLQTRAEDEWDRQMEDDAQTGRLDRLYTRLEEENAGQPEVPLDDFLDQSQLPKAL